MSRRPRFLEFFAGAGLARLALEPDWRCVFANDLSEKKAAVYRANFGQAELQVGDVASLEADELPEAEMAWASFPCQDLSLAGWRRGLRAPRSGAFWPFWRLMREMHEAGRRPPVIVIENVVGLLSGQDFAGLCEALAELDLVFGAMVIDARWFVPQSRPRVFIVAADPARVGEFRLAGPDDSPWFPPSLVRAWESLSPATRERWAWWRLPVPEGSIPPIGQLIETAPPGARWLDEAETARLQAMMSSPNQAKLQEAARIGGRQVGFLYRRTRQGRQRAEVRFDGLAGCLRTPEGGSSRQTVVIVENGDVRMRLLAPREAARLMGAPDSFLLPDKYNDAYRAMGDGVAVPAVRWLAEKLLLSLTESAQT